MYALDVLLEPLAPTILPAMLKTLDREIATVLSGVGEGSQAPRSTKTAKDTTRPRAR